MSKYGITVFLVFLAAAGAAAAPAGSPALNNPLWQFLTNAPGHHELRPQWKGETHVTVATGDSSNQHDPEQERLEKLLHFDLLITTEDRSVFHIAYRVAEPRGGYTGQFDYSPTLPSDRALQECRTLSDLKSLLRRAPGPRDAWGLLDQMHSFGSWALFTITPTNTIETLAIKCDTTYRKGERVENVEGLQIRRGTFRPAR